MKTEKQDLPADRIVITLPGEIKKRFKLACVTHDLDMTLVIRELVIKWLAENGKK